MNSILTDIYPNTLPWSDIGKSVSEKLQHLGNSNLSTIFRAWVVNYIYQEVNNNILLSDQNPISATEALLERVLNLTESMHDLSILMPDISHSARTGDTKTTYDHFGTLFSTNANKVFWEQPYKQLKIRLERNSIDLSIFQDSTIIDIGCGSGRNAFVLRDFGAKKVIGIDISETNIALANKRKAELGIGDEVVFIKGSAMDLPFDDNSFDIAFSMGVFHHTPDWKKCMHEMYRVMKPSAIGLLLYLNEQPGGLFYDTIDFLRYILRHDNPYTIQKSLELLHVDTSRIIGILDPLLCEINVKLTKEEIESVLSSLGAYHIRRFIRGADHDHIEKIYNKEAFAQEKYGVGEHRYIFYKSELQGK